MRTTNGRHERIINDLVQNLKKWNPENKVKTHLIYPRGEIDIMSYFTEYRQTYSEYLPTFIFNIYEIKSNDNFKAREKAQKQLNNFQEYIKHLFKKEDKRIHLYYVYGTQRDIYTIAELGTHECLEMKIGGW